MGTGRLSFSLNEGGERIMASYYSIVQYLPDPTIDERINVGVIAFDERNVRVKFLDNWKRVRHFGGRDISFLLDFAKSVQQTASIQMQLPDFANMESLDRSFIHKMADNWINSIQVTQPRASLLSAD